jgi:hypothetical protein
MATGVATVVFLFMSKLLDCWSPINGDSNATETQVIMKNHVVATIAAAIALAAGGPASASTATATLSSFQIRLIDLNTSDDITPSVVFQDFQGGTFVAAESGTSADHLTDIHAGGSCFGEASSTAAQGVAASFAALSGDAFGGSADVSGFASASLPGTYSASTVWLGDGNNYVSFTLSADTRMVISGDASASVTNTFDDPSANAFASVFLKLTDYTGVDNASYGSAEAEQYGATGTPASPITDARHIEISFENLDSASADGIFFGSVDASASDLSPMASVPEPSGIALALAGLGMLGLVRHRRHLAVGAQARSRHALA